MNNIQGLLHTILVSTATALLIVSCKGRKPKR